MRTVRCSALSLVLLSWEVIAKWDGGKIAPTFETNPLFFNRAYHSTIVLDNYLYIDGGEITTWNGRGDDIQTETWQTGDKNGNIITLPSNWTYSIDLSTSWTNRSVILNPIQHNSPPLNREALWLLDNKIYRYDGGVGGAIPNSWQYSPKTNQFSQFHPTGDSGHWTQETVITPPTHPPLIELDQAFYASGNNLGFAVGGIEDDSSVYDYTDTHYGWRRIPGIVVFNETSQTWFNASTKDFIYNGLAIQGSAHFVSNFGPEGILFALGGIYAEGPTAEPDYGIPLDTAYMFEPVSKQWQKQKVTGDYPTTTSDQCVVGLEGDDGTYEIFMYGGRNAVGNQPDKTILEDTINLGAVWVLSLPSFHWTRQPDPLPFGRWYHSCSIAGTYNRQMISVGGMVATDAIPAGKLSQGVVDRWDQGIGVFDMSDMEWKSSFDHSAAPYVTPSLIKDYLENNDRFPSWDNTELEEWFVKQARFTRSISNTGGSGSTNTGAIAGGAVGGVAGLAIIFAVVACILYRRKRRNREAAWEEGMRKDVYLNEIDSSRDRAELSAKRDPAEHAGTQIHELEGGRKPGG